MAPEDYDPNDPHAEKIRAILAERAAAATENQEPTREQYLAHTQSRRGAGSLLVAAHIAPNLPLSIYTTIPTH